MALDDDDRIQNASSVFDGVRKWNARTLADCSAASGYAFTIEAPPTPEQVDAMCANSDCVVLLNEVLVGAFRSPQYEQMPEFDRPLGFFGYWMIEYCTFHHITDTPCGADPLEDLLVNMAPIVSVCEARSGVSIRRAIQYSSLVRASGSKGTIPPLPPFAAMCDVAECDNIMRRLFMRISMPLCEVGVDTEAVKSPLMNSYMRECNTAARLSWYKEPSMPLPLLYTILPGPLPLDRILRPPTNATTAPPTARPSLKTKPPMPPRPVETSPAPTAIPTESSSTTMPMTLPVVPRTTAAATTSRTMMAPQSLNYANQAPTDSSSFGPRGGNEAAVPPMNRQQRSMTPPPSVAGVDESDAVVPIAMRQGSSEPVMLRFALIGVSTALVLLIVWLLVRRRRRVLGSKETAHSSTENASEYHSFNDTVSDSASVSGSGDHTIAHDLLVACPEIAVNQLDDVRIIGSGGYGVVYLVRDTLNKRLLASKRLGRNQRLAHQVDAFVAEINLAATLSHPRIVTFVGVAGLHKTGLQALFEYMAGGDLKRYLDSQPPTNPAHHSWTPEKLQIAIDIADALAYLHTRTPKPVVHRDLKSRNVMLTSDRRAKLGDFGVSRTESAAGSMTTGVGTSRWVAPEVILGGGDYTTACDVYSFGVVLSELDTHRLPFSELVHTNGEQLADFVLLPLVALQRKQPSFSETCPPSILKFEFEAPRMKPALRQLLSGRVPSYTNALQVAEQVWLVICTVAAQQLWLRRNDAVFRGDQVHQTALVRSIWRALERQLEVFLAPKAFPHHDDHQRPAFAALWTLLTTTGPGVIPVTHDVRLYFDGGSRGNPGIAGGGSLILEQEPARPGWHLVWWKASFLGDDKTNNYAEHTALAVGVQECVRRYQDLEIRLHVIGDSRLVLQQAVGQATTTNRSLRRILTTTTTELCNFPNLNISHTLRAGNTMADLLANRAMHDRASATATSTWTDTDSQLAEKIASDTSFPLTAITRRSPHDLLRDLDRTIERQLRHEPD